MFHPSSLCSYSCGGKGARGGQRQPLVHRPQVHHQPHCLPLHPAPFHPQGDRLSEICQVRRPAPILGQTEALISGSWRPSGCWRAPLLCAISPAGAAGVGKAGWPSVCRGTGIRLPFVLATWETVALCIMRDSAPKVLIREGTSDNQEGERSLLA